MKKIILLVLSWPLFSYYPYAQEKQKEKSKENSREIIIITNGDKEKKYTLETKDGEVFINGKPSSEYKDDDINIVKQKFGKGKNFLYAPGNDKFQLFDNWDNKGGFLGITTEETDGGAKITDVTKGSAADKAGLKAGDVITKIGDKTITDENDVYEAVTSHKAKEDVTISYKRDGKASDTKATLEERKSFSKSFSYNGSKWDSGFNFSMPKIPDVYNNVKPFSSTWGFNRGKLGLYVEDTDNESGVKVTDVDDESLGAKAGVKENDIITEINGKQVKNVNEVKKELAELKDKSSYNIKVKRNGADMNLEVKIPKKVNKAGI